MRFLRCILPMIILFVVNSFITYGTDLYLAKWISFLLHFLGGAVTAWTIYNLKYYYKPVFGINIKPAWLIPFLVIAAVVSVGVAWECLEFLHDLFSDFKYQSGLADTMYDLIMDAVGAAAFVILAAGFKLDKKKLI